MSEDDGEHYPITGYELENLNSDELLDLWGSLRQENKQEYEECAREYDFPVEYPEKDSKRDQLAEKLMLYKEGLSNGERRRKRFDTKLILSGATGAYTFNYVDEVGSFLSKRSSEEVQRAIDVLGEVPELGIGVAAFGLAYAATWKSLDRILEGN